jgi:hypothetical protein
MKTYHLSGIVHPERALLTMSSEKMEIQIFTQQDELFGIFRFNVYNNQVTIILNCEDETASLETIRNYVKFHIETFLNAYGFTSGRAYNLEIVKVYDSDLDVTWVYGIDIPLLEERNRNLYKDSHFGNVVSLSTDKDGVYLRRCLADVNLAMIHLEDSAFYCYRAIEALRQHFGVKANSKDDKKQWKLMAAALSASEDDIEEIKRLAAPSRHGLPTSLNEDDRAQIFIKTWEIVDKYIAYRLTDNADQQH